MLKRKLCEDNSYTKTEKFSYFALNSFYLKNTVKSIYKRHSCI